MTRYTMIYSYTCANGNLTAQTITHKQQLTLDSLWLDLDKPTEEEMNWIADIYTQPLPGINELVEIEATSRFYQDETGLHIRSYFLHETPDHMNNVTVAFILNDGRLFTLHDEVSSSFKKYQQRLESQKDLTINAFDLMLGLYETKVDRIADLLEQLHIDLEALTNRVFNNEEQEFDTVLTMLSLSQDKNDKIRLSLMDKQRALSFLLRSRNSPEKTLPLLHDILRDIRSLGEHSTFLFEKVQFLMTATMGRISIEQNKIIKIFSIAAVVFLPPTLIASIYGMNFRVMPELAWLLGYPLALILMLGAGLAPYYYFKRKKWF